VQPDSTPHPSLRNHWSWRPEWASDRPRLLWYLTFDSHPELARAARVAQERLRAVPTVDLVPVPWLHLTLEDVGFVDELPPEQVDRVVATADAAVADWTPPALTLGPLAPMEDAVVLQADPAHELDDLRGRLRGATSAVLGPTATSILEHHPPHVTLGYLNDSCDPSTVMAPLEPCVEQVQVVVPRVTLAAVTRRDRHYQWTARAELALGS
jgi:2'-5' RNA ligase